MKIVIVLCHPRPGSFNHTLAERARDLLVRLGHSVIFHDLYADGFNPVLSAPELARGFSLDEEVQLHSRQLSECSGLLVFHPDWWGQPPAMLKGWIDRVLRPGVAYEFEGEEFLEKIKAPLLSGKKGLVFTTSDTAATAEVLTRLWREAVLGYCGMEAECFAYRDARGADPSGRSEWVTFVEKKIAQVFPAESVKGENEQPAAQRPRVLMG